MYKFAVIFFVGMLGIWKAVPAGFLLKAPPHLVFILTASGAATSVAVICLLGNWVKARLARKGGRLFLRKMHRGGELLQKYGVPGLGVLGTILLGPNFATVIGLFFVGGSRRLFAWVIAGVLFWSAVLTVSAHLGLGIFSRFVPIKLPRFPGS
jgi:hypothetical protein